MIPLIWFLVAWLAILAVFAVMALVSVLINIRFGLASFGTYAISAIFLIVAVFVILLTGSYIATVDWSQSLNILPAAAPNYTL